MVPHPFLQLIFLSLIPQVLDLFLTLSVMVHPEPFANKILERRCRHRLLYRLYRNYCGWLQDAKSHKHDSICVIEKVTLQSLLFPPCQSMTDQTVCFVSSSFALGNGLLRHLVEAANSQRG